MLNWSPVECEGRGQGSTSARSGLEGPAYAADGSGNGLPVDHPGSVSTWLGDGRTACRGVRFELGRARAESDVLLSVRSPGTLGVPLRRQREGPAVPRPPLLNQHAVARPHPTRMFICPSARSIKNRPRWTLGGDHGPSSEMTPGRNRPIENRRAKLEQQTGLGRRAHRPTAVEDWKGAARVQPELPGTNNKQQSKETYSGPCTAHG